MAATPNWLRWRFHHLAEWACKIKTKLNEKIKSNQMYSTSEFTDRDSNPYKSLTQLWHHSYETYDNSPWEREELFLFKNRRKKFLLYKVIIRIDDIMFIKGSAECLIHWQPSIFDGLYSNLSGSPLFAWCLAQNRHSYVLSESHHALQSS